MDKTMRIALRLLLLGFVVLIAWICLNGCTLLQPPINEDLKVTVMPEEGGYPPLLVTITVHPALDMIGGQFTFELDGKTHQQGGNVLKVTVNDLPCQGGIIWEKAGQIPREAIFEIPLVNSGPVICPLRLNGIDNAWYIHPRYRYLVDFPGTYDPEGGPVKLVEATVQPESKEKDNTYDTIYCPPYQGPDVFHAKLFGTYGGRIIENAFVFHSLWTAPIDLPGVQTESTSWTGLPFSPPGYGESGYPGSHCFEYDKTRRPSQMTTITATFEDEKGARTTESWKVPTGANPGCNIYSADCETP